MELAEMRRSLGLDILKRLGAVASALAVFSVSACAPGVQGEETYADDGKRLLSMYPGSGSFGMDVPDDVDAEGMWSGMFGMFLPCLATGTPPVELEDVSWDSSAGMEPESVEVYVRTFNNEDGTPIGSMIGTPSDPFHREFFEDVELREGVSGLLVDRQCDDGSGSLPIKGSEDEVIFVVRTDSSGANIENISFSFNLDSQEYEVVTDWNLYLCGSSAPKTWRCG